VIHEQVHRRAGNEGGQLLHEFDGLEEEVRRAIAPHGLELDEDAPVGAEAEAVLGERGAQEIATELLEAGAIVEGDPDVGVEVEAVELSLARAAGGEEPEARLVAEAADAGAGTGAEGDAALDGRPNEAGQDWRGFGERVRRGCVVGGLQVATGEQQPDTGADGGKDVRHIVVARWGAG